MNYSKDLMDKFTDETFRRLSTTSNTFDSLYFGGGTPSLLGSERAKKLINAVSLNENCEITLESNPNIDFTTWKNSGINRLSLGMQSINENELKSLGRTHTKEQIIKSINTAKDIGIDNISLDLMIGISGMTKESLSNSIDFCVSQNIQHVSSYMLKIEEGTEYFKHKKELMLPDDDYTAELYLFMAEKLEQHGFMQYEISNFSKPGFESRHNTKYWDCEEYEAFGPSAHSYMNGKRCYFPRDLEYYLNGGEKLFDSIGGEFEEFAMLKLRLVKGLERNECEKFGNTQFDSLLNNCKKIPKNFIVTTNDNIHFTKEGFLLSNSILSMIL